MAEQKKTHIVNGKYVTHDEYVKLIYDDLRIRVPKGKKQLISDYAETHGESINGFVNRAIDEAMEK